MKLYIDKREAFILDLALMNLRQHYPNTYGPEAKELQDKLYRCIQLQKAERGSKMKRINEIRNELRSIAEAEATKVYRLARRAQAHGCSERLVMMIREEGHQLYRMNPEDLMNPFLYWQYAFKF